MRTKRKRHRFQSESPEAARDDRPRQRLAAARDALRRIRRGEAPTAAELAAAPRLDFWWIVAEQPFCVLRGMVTGHPAFADGTLVGTSPLLWLAADRRAARTVSRFYRLGPPADEIASHPH